METKELEKMLDNYQKPILEKPEQKYHNLNVQGRPPVCGGCGGSPCIKYTKK